MTMGQAISKEHPKYVSISKSSRNIILEYVCNNEIRAKRYYDFNSYDKATIIEDAKRLHIDIEYEEVPVFVNNLNMNMEEFFEMGEVISPKEFLDKIAVIDIEKL